MSQVLHIFRKDARRFWPEIAVSLAVLAILAWVGPFGWRSEFANVRLATGVNILPLLVVLIWSLLITRVVQAESLVGDTQFWLTRPYDWKKLLAAKVLFVGVFVYVPLLVVQCVLLWRAGFHPVSLAGDLIYNLLLITGVLVAPIFAIACVTSSVASVVLTILGILGCIAAFAATVVLWQGVNGAVLPSSGVPQMLCLCVCVVAIVLEYATRRVWVARLVLLSVPVLLFVNGELAPHLVGRVYARQDRGDQTPLKLAYRTRPNEGFPASLRSSKEIVFGIPVSAVEAPDHTIPVIENVRMTVEAADGSRWVSPWESMWGVVTGQGATVSISMPRAVYDRFKGKPLALELALAVAEGREQGSAHIPLASSGEAALGEGICMSTSTLSGGSGSGLQNVKTQCRYALRQPLLTHVALLRPNGVCSPIGKGAVEGGSWSGTLDRKSPYFSINPIWLGPNENEGVSYAAGKGSSASECPASEVLVAQYDLAARLETTVTIPNFELPSLSPESGN